ncbi:hypothetical protein FJ987_16460 [Mesorhizobium sp. CU2]|uniref:hypothetical protein n=1 Tax=unclassified Mesorhizobium TaxID=325217 RepID=UPI00112ADDAE|nr:MULTISPECIES: hypothetical protein [unclassified Mesorhizobium]TPN82561.1 hypothetical protein FJ988_15510 [Mesorhizobium sp. CU3]TPO12766.1 hypothetical protein FJ987_16460 [Mesorhizobium sp. CU2]
MPDTPSTKISLIVSPDAEPTIKVRAGTKVELIELDAVYITPDTPKMVLGTLCGYSSTYCVAVVEAK